MSIRRYRKASKAQAELGKLSRNILQLGELVKANLKLMFHQPHLARKPFKSLNL